MFLSLSPASICLIEIVHSKGKLSSSTLFQTHVTLFSFYANQDTELTKDYDISILLRSYDSFDREADQKLHYPLEILISDLVLLLWHIDKRSSSVQFMNDALF